VKVELGMAARRIAQRLLSDPAVERIRHRRQNAERERQERAFAGEPYDIDLTRLDVIREADADQLVDQAWLESGLIPKLGVNPDHFQYFPRQLEHCTGGLHAWQYPSQFAPYLCLLARLPIKSYVEIGTRHGGSFVTTCEYLKRFQPLDWALGADLYKVPALERYAQTHDWVQTYVGSSQSARFAKLMERNHLDLVLIDGDHTERGCWSDTQLMLPRSNILVLHDIVNGLTPGVASCWQRLQVEQSSNFDFYEFTAQYEDVLERLGHPVLGLGVAIRKGFPN